MITVFDIVKEKLQGKTAKFICSQKDQKKNFTMENVEVQYFNKDKGLICIEGIINGEKVKKHINIWFVRIELK